LDFIGLDFTELRILGFQKGLTTWGGIPKEELPGSKKPIKINFFIKQVIGVPDLGKLLGLMGLLLGWRIGFLRKDLGGFNGLRNWWGSILILGLQTSLKGGLEKSYYQVACLFLDHLGAL